MPPKTNGDRLDDVYAAIERDKAFAHFRADGNRFVRGEGDTSRPRVMIIGEAPGAQEAIQLRPFVGDSGKVLRTFMRNAGLFSTWHGKLTGMPVPAFCAESSPPNCWLTNVIKYRPPKNRTPTLAEIDSARPYLCDEWLAVGAPRIIIPVGAVALRAIMPRTRMSITFAAGKRFDVSINPSVTGVLSPYRVTVAPMLHPQFLLHGGKSALSKANEDWIDFGNWTDGY